MRDKFPAMTESRSIPLPRKVWVGPYEFPVRVVPTSDPVLDSGVADGATVTLEEGRGIFLSEQLDRRKLLEIVTHEVTHAINWAYDIEDGVEEEAIASQHGIAWSQFLLDNPRYQRWLTSTLNAIRRERSSA